MKDQTEQDELRINKAIDELSEFFDTVHVFATRDEPDGTVALQRGAGNWYARYGQIELWVEKEKRREIQPEDET